MNPDLDRTTVSAGDAIDITQSAANAAGVRNYTVDVDESDLARTTVVAGNRLTVAAGTADPSTGAIAYTVGDPLLDFFLSGGDLGVDRAGIDLIGGTNVTITSTEHSDRVAYTINSTSTATDTTYKSASDTDVSAGEVAINEGTGIDVALSDESGVATYALSLDQDEIDRDTVIAGNGIAVTSVTDAATGAKDYTVAVNQSSLSRPTVVAGSGVTVTAGAADSDGAIAYTVADAGDDISFFLNGTDTTDDREGIDLVAGTNVTISQTAYSDRIAYTINSTATSADITLKSTADSDVTSDEIAVNEGNGIDVALTEVSGVATYALSVDEDELDRTTVIAGDAITVAAGTADAATGARDYTVAVNQSSLSRPTVVAGSGVTVTPGAADSDGAIAYTVADAGDNLSFFLNGTDTGQDRAGIDLVAGTNVTISQTAETDRVAYTINSTSSSSSVTFKSNGNTDRTDDEVRINGDDGIDVDLQLTGGEPVYTITSDFDFWVGGTGYANRYEVAYTEGHAIDLTGSGASPRINLAIAVDESDLDRTTVVAGSGIAVTAGTADASTGAIEYTIASTATAADVTFKSASDTDVSADEVSINEGLELTSD